MAGAPLGNKNRSKTAQKLDSAIKKVLASKGKDEKGISVGLFNLVNALYKQAEGGDVGAIKEFLDRYAGKVKNQVETEHTQYIVQIGGENVPINPHIEPDFEKTTH